MDMFWNALKIFAGLGLIVFVIWGIKASMQPKPFSPTESYTGKLKRISKVSKPFNVQTLGMRGEGMRVHSYLGTVEGLTFVPYVSSEPELNAEGKRTYIEKRDMSGELVLGEDGKPIQIPKMNTIIEKDGDWLFFITQGRALFKKEMLVRAHPSMCSDLGETTWIKTRGLVPVGDYWYPSEQYQADLQKIQTQHKDEVLVETYAHFLDLVANVTQMALGGDPTYQKIIQSQAEVLSNRDAGMLVKQ